jgi:hypothetical protein
MTSPCHPRQAVTGQPEFTKSAEAAPSAIPPRLPRRRRRTGFSGAARSPCLARSANSASGGSSPEGTRDQGWSLSCKRPGCSGVGTGWEPSRTGPQRTRRAERLVPPANRSAQSPHRRASPPLSLGTAFAPVPPRFCNTGFARRAAMYHEGTSIHYEAATPPLPCSGAGGDSGERPTSRSDARPAGRAQVGVLAPEHAAASQPAAKRRASTARIVSVRRHRVVEATAPPARTGSPLPTSSAVLPYRFPVPRNELPRLKARGHPVGTFVTYPWWARYKRAPRGGADRVCETKGP